MRLKIDWASLIVNLPFWQCFTLYLRAIFQEQAPGGGGLYLDGRFNGGCFALPVWGASIWRGLYMANAVPSFLNYFKVLNIAPALGIEPATFRSASRALYRLS